MILKMFSVFDTKAKAYITPFFMPEVGMAVRTFTDCVNDPGHQFGRHPADYTLFQLGSWDNSNGQFKALALPKTLGVGVEFVDIEPDMADTKLELIETLKDDEHDEKRNVSPVLPGAESGDTPKLV